ncbi:MAG: Hydroxymethylglutaryl-CoA lyase YngG [Alphaproteobacteria bacterium MarineAlpha10_Bin3]|jgi:hydroxymethylglutaryl-CoA lyase|nr:MAG: Hydroxymethylglutaryl-CoA lyase YngG [Alphaproteobacteria bacterium MarineAlpha10_Bin3]PPR72544.1 MAG: Hydroxymethylglutaryl-CoA lyase YngG [Alphaproteobacteria bacterium MarineAlpha4_Bin1]
MRPGIDVECREVGLRDGLQIQQVFFATEGKIAWLTAEAAAGMPEIEVCSFVPPKLLPQFADNQEVVAAALAIDGAFISALAPNLKGAQNAFKAGIHKLNYVTSVSESHNMANVRRTVDESVADFERIVAARNEASGDTLLAVGLSTALGCTIEGPVALDAVLKLAERFVAAGADEISVADTVGYANPVQVKEMFNAVIGEFGGRVAVAAHFHDTRGLGLANVFAALEAGCTRFDASLAGLGGCPFAPHATGNIVMDDLVFLLEGAGLKTGVDLDALVKIRDIITANLPDEPLNGMYAKAGPPKGFVPASKAA